MTSGNKKTAASIISAVVALVMVSLALAALASSGGKMQQQIEYNSQQVQRLCQEKLDKETYILMNQQLEKRLTNIEVLLGKIDDKLNGGGN